MPNIRSADGTELFVKDWGDGPAIVFVSSASTTNDIWQYQHAHFVDAGYRIIAFDRRGHGRSDQPGGGYDADTLADDLARVIEARRVGDATLIGHSMGCLEIVRYLARHGSSRVARIVLVGATTPFLLKTADNPDGVPAEAFEMLRSGWQRDFPKWVADNVRPFFVPETTQAMIDWAVLNISQVSVRVALECNKTVVETDTRADCRAISVPTLVVHGGADASAPIDLTARKTASLIEGSQLQVYEDAPHGLMFTHMARLHQDIERFIAN